MSPLETKVRALFAGYGQRSDDALQDPPKLDVDGMVGSFADYFVGSSPQGVMGGANDAKLREVIPQGFAHYREVGGKHMTIKGIRVIELNELHAVADVDWEFTYVNKAGESGHVTFTNYYFVTIAGGPARIFGYVTADEQQALKDHGLVA